MGLNKKEQEILNQIEQELLKEDPELANTVKESTLSYTLFNVSSTGLKSKDDFLSEYSCDDLISSIVFPIQLLTPVHSVRLFEKKIGIFKISEIIEDVSRALNRGDVIIF